jgi:hypothetical protein
MLSTTNNVSTGFSATAVAHLSHHFFVDVQSTGRVDEQHVVDAAPGLRQRVQCDIQWLVRGAGGRDVDV